MQSDAMQCAFDGWRRLWRGKGREYCAGALVWQVTTLLPFLLVLQLYVYIIIPSLLSVVLFRFLYYFNCIVLLMGAEMGTDDS